MDLSSTFSMDVVQKALDGLSLRHTAIASNLANVDTPGYHRKVVSFEDSLKTAISHHDGAGSSQGIPQASNDEQLAMKLTRADHMTQFPVISNLTQLEPQMDEVTDVEYRSDGNSVDVETEMSQLAKNTQRYTALARMEKELFQKLKIAMSGEGG